jgi:malate dehydrogenase (oxaloacetate-decarboxylating)
MDYKKQAVESHRQWHGKLDYRSKVQVTNHDELSVVYTPGVGAACMEIYAHPELAAEMTGIGNLVAVVTDGSAVLGLGNIGPQASLPVMEGKCVLFKEFAGVDAIPIALGVHTTDEIVAAVTALAPSVGGINLEDIAAPICFEVEEQLNATLDIPVMHDDQHGTAVIALAGVINSLKLTNREPGNTRTVILGAGAGGIAVGKLLRQQGIGEIAFVDSKGLITSDREDLNKYKQEVAAWGDFRRKANGDIPQLSEVMRGADLFIGLSGPNLVTTADVAGMNKDPMVFPMANPDPEIMPDAAAEGGAAIIATGRSDFPNQLNNALGFPGIFRGLLDGHIKKVENVHKVAAAHAIANFVSDPTPDEIVPSIFAPGLANAVAQAVMHPEG